MNLVVPIPESFTKQAVEVLELSHTQFSGVLESGVFESRQPLHTDRVKHARAPDHTAGLARMGVVRMGREIANV
jgi:hypothetical protein